MQGSNLKIGVVMGGPSSEHDVSLMTGKNVLKTLQELGHDARQVYITKSGNWLYNNSASAFDPVDICMRHDVMFNAMHGEYGEDGQIQQIFDRCNVRYTGSGTAAAALAMNKIVAKSILGSAGLKLPRGLAFEREGFDAGTAARSVHQMSAPPWVIKPASRGSSVGVVIVRTLPELAHAFEEAFAYDKNVLAEEFIKGREITCGVLENFAGEDTHALHPLEIIPPAGRFFDYEVKYNGATKEVPAPFFGDMLRNIKAQAVTAHKALGCRHYSRTDMIIKGTNIYVLEINTLPGLTSESLFPKQAKLAKIEFPQLLDHLVRLAVA
jgi:D-alanine-D-alanine ligase